MKTCTVCHTDIKDSGFYYRADGRHMQPCKACINKKNAERYRTNPLVRERISRLHKMKYNTSLSIKKLTEFINSLYELELT